MTSCPHPPTHVPTVGPITRTNEHVEYLKQHNITGLLNGMMAGLMIALPEDHVDYMSRAVDSAREMGLENVRWQTFVWKLHPHRNPLRQKLIHPPVKVDGGNLPVGVIEKRDFMLSLADEETIRRPRLPFWHIDYFTQPQLDDPEFFLTPDWTLPDDLDVGPPVQVLRMPESAAVAVRPERLCPSPPPKELDEHETAVSGSGSSVPAQSSVSEQRSEQHSYLCSQLFSDERVDVAVEATQSVDTTESHSTALSPSVNYYP